MEMQIWYNPPTMDYIISTEFDGQQRKLYTKHCEVCGTIFRVPKHVMARRKTCSLKCRGIQTRTRREVTCDLCGKKFESTPSKQSRSKFNFCSRKCKDYAQSIYGGDKFASLRPNHYGIGRTVYRRVAILKYGPKCSRCGYDENRVALQVHHRDKDRSNNKVDNLEVLCANCHAIETWGRGG